MSERKKGRLRRLLDDGTAQVVLATTAGLGAGVGLNELRHSPNETPAPLVVSKDVELTLEEREAEKLILKLDKDIKAKKPYLKEHVANAMIFDVLATGPWKEKAGELKNETEAAWDATWKLWEKVEEKRQAINKDARKVLPSRQMRYMMTSMAKSDAFTKEIGILYEGKNKPILGVQYQQLRNFVASRLNPPLQVKNEHLRLYSKLETEGTSVDLFCTFGPETKVEIVGDTHIRNIFEGANNDEPRETLMFLKGSPAAGFIGNAFTKAFEDLQEMQR